MFEVFKGLAKDGGDAAALAERQSEVANMVEEAILAAPVVLAAAPKIQALENSGQAAAVDDLQRDSVRMMSICASVADGADATETGPKIEALAQDIASALKKSGRESCGASQRSSAGDAAADAAGLYLPALTRSLLPQVEALDAAEEEGAAQARRRSTKKSATEAARKTFASLTEAVFTEGAPESDPAALQQLQADAQAAVSDVLVQVAEPQRQSQRSVAGVPAEEAEAELPGDGVG